jgi:hypothetical protein
VDIIGVDLAKVSPPFDASGATAFPGISIMFELLCQIAVRHGLSMCAGLPKYGSATLFLGENTQIPTSASGVTAAG